MTTEYQPEYRPYIAMYAGRKLELYANSSYEAQQKAAQILKVKPNKAYQVSVYLADVTHSTASL